MLRIMNFGKHVTRHCADSLKLCMCACVGGDVGDSEAKCVSESGFLPLLVVTNEEPVFSGMFAPLPVSL